jgi:hypothetical protein
MGDFPRAADGRRIFTAKFTRVRCAASSMAMPMGEVAGHPSVLALTHHTPGGPGDWPALRPCPRNSPVFGSRLTLGRVIRPRPPGSSGESTSVSPWRKADAIAL